MCMRVLKVIKTRKPRTAYVTREYLEPGKFKAICANFRHSYKVTDPEWCDYFESKKFKSLVNSKNSFITAERGVLHISPNFKYLKKSIQQGEFRANEINTVILEIEIPPGLILEGVNIRCSNVLTNKRCYGVKEYRVKRIIFKNFKNEKE